MFSLFPFIFETSGKPSAKVKEKPINTLQEIRKGRPLGEGGYGCAYQVGDKVYKIYHKNYDNFDAKEGEKPTRLAERSAKYWNLVYKELGYADLAKATFRTIEDRDVLITPFIKGKYADLTKTDSVVYKKFKEAMKKLPVAMFDYIGYGNVIIMDSTGDPVPVDYDALFLRAKRLGMFKSTHAYFADEEPPSPGSRFWAHRYYKDLVLDYRPPKP